VSAARSRFRWLYLGPVKSDSSARAVALPKACVEALIRHRANQDSEPRWPEVMAGAGLVFTTTRGIPFEPRNLNRHFVRMCERAGVRLIRFHDLRHSCATLLYEQGVPLEKHPGRSRAQPTITKTIYIEVTQRVQRTAVEKLGHLFDEPEPGWTLGSTVGVRGAATTGRPLRLACAPPGTRTPNPLISGDVGRTAFIGARSCP
jgi:hypothetical protein